MAQRVVTYIVSDLSGEELPEGSGATLTFGWQGVEYEIDLTDAEADELTQVMERYVKVARRTGGRKQRRQRPAAA